MRVDVSGRGWGWMVVVNETEIGWFVVESGGWRWMVVVEEYVDSGGDDQKSTDAQAVGRVWWW